MGGKGNGVPRPGSRQADYRRHRAQGAVGARDHQRLSYDPRAAEQVPEPHRYAFVDEGCGGASKSEVILSEDVIDFPKALGIDLQLSLTQESCSKYYKDIKPNGILLVDEDFVRDIPKGDFQVIRLPIIRTAAEEIGKAFVANIVATGAITAIPSGAVRMIG